LDTNIFITVLFIKYLGIGDWGLGIGDWGLGGGGQTPKPQPPKPKPQTQNIKFKKIEKL